MRTARLKDVEASENGPPGAAGLFENPETVRTFVLAGNARLTLRSLATGARFSYRVRRAPDDGKPDKKRPWFVSVLIGADNESSYQYMGTIWRMSNTMLTYDHGSKSKIGLGAPSAMAWNYFFGQVLVVGQIPAKLEVWHEGRCGRCGRALTVPESIARGIGPECAGKEK